MTNREKAVYNLSKIDAKLNDYVKALGITEEQGINIFKDDDMKSWKTSIADAQESNKNFKGASAAYIQISDLLALPDSSVKACQTSAELAALVSRLTILK